MKKNIFLTAIFAVFALVLTLTPELAFADGGDQALDDLVTAMTGSIGTFVGLGIALFGLYTWLVQQNSWGVMMIIAGIAITAFPGIFDSLRAGLADTVDGASNTNFTRAQ